MPALSDDTRLRVLVVDDDADTADSLALLLGLWGHEVRAAHTGANALELCAAWDPDVAVLDLVMPGMSGLRLARLLQSKPGLEHLTLVALTGMAPGAYGRQAEAAGFAYCLVKPANMGLLQRLLTALAAQEVRQAAPATMPGAEYVRTSARVTASEGASLEALARRSDGAQRSGYLVRTSREDVRCGRALAARSRERVAQMRLLLATCCDFPGRQRFLRQRSAFLSARLRYMLQRSTRPSCATD